MENAEAFATLLSEGLDLCIRARSLDDQAIKASMRGVAPESAEMYPETYGRSGTPYLWVQEQYDRDLADWEQRTKEELIKRGFMR